MERVEVTRLEEIRAALDRSDMKWLIRRVEKLEEALKFYSNPQEYFKDQKEFFPRNESEGVVYFPGEIARQALAEEEEK